MSKTSKTTKITEQPRLPQKATKLGENPSFFSLNPSWSFLKADLDHQKWGIKNNSSHLGDMLERFKALESMTWCSILTTTSGRPHNTQSHSIPLGKIIKEAVKRLEELRLDDYDALYSITITGRQRVWGVMDGDKGLFMLLWYDAEHEIYPVQKK